MTSHSQGCFKTTSKLMLGIKDFRVYLEGFKFSAGILSATPARRSGVSIFQTALSQAKRYICLHLLQKIRTLENNVVPGTLFKKYPGIGEIGLKARPEIPFRPEIPLLLNLPLSYTSWPGNIADPA